MDTPLRKYRTERKLTLDALADSVGVTPGQLSRIEREGTTSFPRALALAQATGLPVTDFRPVEKSAEAA